MIKREYFFRAKVHHDDDPYIYTYCSGTFTLKTFFKVSEKRLFKIAKELGYKEITIKSPSLKGKSVEITALNRL
jgi:hypothetical protein